MNEDQVKSRPYRSVRRAAEAAATRRRILLAARDCFVSTGFGGVTVGEIAARSGVSVQTVYNSVGGKAQLLAALREVVDEAGEVVAIQQRVAASTDPVEIVALTARLRRLLMEGASDIVDLLAATAPSDPDVAAVYAQGQASSRAGCARVVTRLAALGDLRPDWDQEMATDALYTLLHHAVWTRLVVERGWTPDAFEAWCADLLARTFLAPRAPRAAG